MKTQAPHFLLSLICLAAVSSVARAQTENLAPTPPMGWASWNRNFCDYDEKTIRDQADALVSTGLRDRGYRYVLIQECIATGRDPDGRLLVDSKRFPSGIPSLAKYIHDRGLKAGIYTDIGSKTCFPDPSYEGLYQHEEQDVATFAIWSMDLIEVDYCNKPEGRSGREIYERVAAAIKRTGRPMLLYICSWGNEQPWEWGPGVGQMWRTDFDVSLERGKASWDRVVGNFKSNARHAVFSAPGGWNDPDMLEVGNQGLSSLEARSMLAMWAVSAAPLLLGNDLTNMDEVTKNLLLNAEVVAIDQDPFGAQATLLHDSAVGQEVWIKPLGSRSSGRAAVLLLNLSDKPAHMSVRWSDIDVESIVKVRNVLRRGDVRGAQIVYEADVAPHGSELVVVQGTFSWVRGVNYEAEWPGNERGGTVALTACGECSGGYAIAIGADGSDEPGFVTLNRLEVPSSSSYRLSLHYVRNGLANQTVTVTVNDENPQDVLLLMHSASWATLRVNLKRGINRIKIQASGPRKVYLDSANLVPCN